MAVALNVHRPGERLATDGEAGIKTKPQRIARNGSYIATFGRWCARQGEAEFSRMYLTYIRAVERRYTDVPAGLLHRDVLAQGSSLNVSPVRTSLYGRSIGTIAR